MLLFICIRTLNIQNSIYRIILCWGTDIKKKKKGGGGSVYQRLNFQYKDSQNINILGDSDAKILIK